MSCGITSHESVNFSVWDMPQEAMRRVRDGSWLRAATALPEDLGLIPNTLLAAHNCLP